MLSKQLRRKRSFKDSEMSLMEKSRSVRKKSRLYLILLIILKLEIRTTEINSCRVLKVQI
jgi:hypothetical protein